MNREELKLRVQAYAEISDAGAQMGLAHVAHDKTLRRLTVIGGAGAVMAGTALALGATSVVVKGLFLVSASAMVTSFFKGMKAGLNGI